MLKQKKLPILIIFILSVFLLIGCTTTSTVPSGYIILPDLSGNTTTEVEDYFENLGIDYKITVKSGLLYGDEEYSYDTFYGYAGSSNTIGSLFDTTKRLTVYVTAANLYDSLDDLVAANSTLSSIYEEVTLEGKTYTGKSFLETGLGEVTVTGYVDGDTTNFKDKNGTSFSLRYLGIDTPESTAAFEPWGKAASKYTRDSLENAKKIVLEAESAGQTDTNGRYLGWVWYQDQSDEWHILNLELIAFCYSKDKASTDSTYCDLSTAIGNIVAQTGRRVYGELDPDYDYSTDPKEISIEELRTNFAEYYSRKVKVTGVIAMLDGLSPYIIDPETGYGIYYYIPIWTSAAYTYNLVVGNEVTIEGVATYYGSSTDVDLDSLSDNLANGSPQLTDFKEGCLTLVSKDNSVSPKLLSASSLKEEYLGMYCQFNSLTVVSVYTASSGSGTTVNCEDALGNEISIRIDSSHYYIEGSQENGIKVSDFTIGREISSVIGGLSYYYGYQVSVVDSSNIIFSN
ncbi:MAG: thermonuclease family protein [Bacillales bacterium]|nr:thermonuclease family protein [Bacillales bacterium]